MAGAAIWNGRTQLTGSAASADSTPYTDVNGSGAVISVADALDRVSGCWISFTDAEGNPTDVPYLHWYGEVAE